MYGDVAHSYSKALYGGGLYHNTINDSTLVGRECLAGYLSPTHCGPHPPELPQLRTKGSTTWHSRGSQTPPPVLRSSSVLIEQCPSQSSG